MKHLFLITGICIAIFAANAQTPKPLRLQDCYTLARQNYPLVKRQQLITKSAAYSIENAGKGYLPQISINGQASYQSDVTQVPIKLPGADIPTISKDQYKAYADLNQTIYDGGAIKLKKQAIQAEADLNSQQLEVDLYQLKERVNQLFFGVLIADQQIAQTDTVKRNVQLGLAKTNAAITNGTALKSNADVLNAELLKLDQRSIELKAGRSAYIQMLGLFINQPLDDRTLLEMPAPVVLPKDLNRPELTLFDAQKKLIGIQQENITSKNSPKLGFFMQGGYGRPALNMLQNKFDSYYIGGLRLSWSLSGLYTAKKERSILALNSQSVDYQKETFLLNTNLQLKQDAANQQKNADLIASDSAIIALRGKIKNTALAQLQYGVINANDYLREVNAEDQAKAKPNAAQHSIADGAIQSKNNIRKLNKH